MICPNCNTEIADNCTFCTECGTQVQETPTIDSAVDNSNDAVADNAIRNQLTITLCVLLGILAIFLVIFLTHSQNIENPLQGEWYYVDIDDDYNIDRRVVLEFDNGNVELRWEGGYLNKTFFSGKYQVTSSKTIKIDRFGYGYDELTIKFNDDKNIFFIVPGIIDSSSTEAWRKA